MYHLLQSVVIGGLKQVIGLRKQFAIGIFWLISAHLMAQSSGEQAVMERFYADITSHFTEGHWAPAYEQSQTFLQRYPRAEVSEQVRFIQVISALKGHVSDAHTLAAAFMEDSPGGVRAEKVRIALADHWFAEKRYAEAEENYEAVTQNIVSSKEYVRSQYFTAYCAYLNGNKDKALTKFQAVTYYQDDFRTKAAYYAGAILYNQDRMEEALRFLIMADEAGSLPVSGMIANVYFKLDRKDDLIKYAQSKAQNSDRTTRIALFRLLGEVYFERRDFAQASEYFQKSVDLSRKGVEAGTYYKLAFSYDQLGQSDRAIEYYKVAALQDSEVGQLSAFRLGELYVDQENYQYAAQSFEQASRMAFNVDMQEQATFLPGKLKLKGGNFDEAIADLEAYVAAYPDARWRSEATDLLAEAFLRTSNYEKAIEHIEGLPRQTSITRAAYQQVTFLKGQQLFNEARFTRSQRYFSKSLRYTPDTELVARSYYWMAESYVASGQSGEASSAYQSCLNLSGGREVRRLKGLSHYGLGYIAYNEQRYRQAATHFRSYLGVVSGDDPYYQDATVRLADCQYVTKAFDAAKAGYEGLLESDYDRKDYLYFQLGLVAYQSGDATMAEQQFQRVLFDYPRSPYADNAAFQNGQMCFENADFPGSIRAFTMLIERYNKSGLLPFALVRRGLSHANLAQLEESGIDLSRVLAEFPGHEAASDAILGLQDLQKRGHEIDGFDQLLATYKGANPESSSLESIDFEQIKTQYFKQRYAILDQMVNQFVNDYPSSNFLPDVYYYLADGYYRSFDYDAAITNFDRLLDFPNFDYYQRVLDKRGKSLLLLKRDREAVQNYQLLTGAARNPREQHGAREGLMKAYLDIDADSALYFADQILAASWKPVNGGQFAQLTKLRIYFQQEDMSLARPLAQELQRTSSDEIGAEATFLLSTMLSMESALEESNQSIFELLKRYGSYAEWTDRGYLLLIDNYMEMEELLQAAATANSIIDKSENPDLRTEAEKRLLKIQQLEQALLRQEQDSLKQQVQKKDSIE